MTLWWPDEAQLAGRCLGLPSSQTSVLTAFETPVLHSPESPDPRCWGAVSRRGLCIQRLSLWGPGWEA